MSEHLTQDFFQSFRLGDTGFIDSINVTEDHVCIAGWAICLGEDPLSCPQKLFIVYNDVIVAELSDFKVERPDVANAFEGAPEQCGFQHTITDPGIVKNFTPFLLEAFSESYIGNVYQLHKEQKYTFLLQLEPTGICNLRCPQCPNTLFSGFNNLDISSNDIDLVAPLIHQASTIAFDGFGEFFMSKNIHKAVQIASPKTHCLAHTNGMLVNKHFDFILDSAPPFRQLIFSLDSLDPEKYEIIRKGGKLKTVLDNMRELKRRRDDRGQRLPYIVPNMKIMNLTFHEMKDFFDLAAEFDSFLEIVYLYDAVKLTGEKSHNDDILSYENQQPRFKAQDQK
jgi:pyruvate-formate lyase-activating enzyme